VIHIQNQTCRLGSRKLLSSRLITLGSMRMVDSFRPCLSGTESSACPSAGFVALIAPMRALLQSGYCHGPGLLITADNVLTDPLEGDLKCFKACTQVSHSRLQQYIL
jgi:hypothetical protein